MNDTRRHGLLNVTRKIEDLRRELEAFAADEYTERDSYFKGEDEYDICQWNGASLEDAASFLGDALKEIEDAVTQEKENDFL